MLSFWEKACFIEYDHIIVGSGIVGLSTAATIIEKMPGSKVLVLEAGILPSGASTKNAGFACFGSLGEILADLEIMGIDETISLIERRMKGLSALRQRLGDKAIGFKNYGGFELIFESDPKLKNQINDVNKLLLPLFKNEVFTEAPEKVQEFRFNNNKVKTIISNPFEGQINTGKMMQSLIRYVTGKGVQILTGARVIEINSHDKGVTISAVNIDGNHIDFKARSVAICTNAFTRKLFPELDIIPGRGQVLITKPIPGLVIKGVFHYNEGYFYFRNFENCVIFGGGRNLDKQTEETTEFGSNEVITQKLVEDLQTIILPEHKFEIDMWWSGIMAFGSEKQPIISAVKPGVIVAARMGGMGIALGTLAGKEAAELLMECV